MTPQKQTRVAEVVVTRSRFGTSTFRREFYYIISISTCAFVVQRRKLTSINLYLNLIPYRTVKTLRLYYKNNMWAGL